MSRISAEIPPELTWIARNKDGFYILALTALRNATIIKEETMRTRETENTMEKEKAVFPMILNETDRFVLIKMEDNEERHTLTVNKLEMLELMMFTDSLIETTKQALSEDFGNFIKAILS